MTRTIQDTIDEMRSAVQLSGQFNTPVADGQLIRDWADQLAEALRAGRPAQPEWRCFHCDEVFTDKAEAEQHFGYEEGMAQSVPVCLLTKEEIAELRDLERQNAALHRENERLENDARLWYESEADRVRRIGNVEWWQEMDSREGEKIVLQEKVASLEAQLRAGRPAADWQPHTHEFEVYDVCMICGLTDAALGGCHLCADPESVKNTRCPRCLRPVPPAPAEAEPR
jgi:phage terminase large subunit GpA-like protein